MSNIKANILHLYDETNPAKQYEVKVDGGYVHMNYFQEGADNLPANRTYYPVSMVKAEFDGIGDVKSYTQATRAKADTNESGLASELVNRASADSTLQSNIDSEAATARAAEAANAALVGTEQTRAQAKEAQIEATHTAYVSSNDAALASEIARAGASEQVNATGISNNSTAISQEAATARAAEQANAAAVTAEAASRVSGDATLQANIDAESARAQAKEASIDSVIANLLSNTDPASIDSLAEIVSAYGNADNALDARLSQLEQQVASLLSFHS
jgi:hypothetical protein